MQTIPIKLLFVVLIIIGSTCANAAVTILPMTVIYDGGKTVPISTLLADDIDERFQLNKAIDERTLIEETDAAASNVTYSATNVINNQFPIKSELKVTRLPSNHIDAKNNMMNKSIYIFGDDRFSIEWVMRNKEELLRLGAVGLITNIESFERYQAIQRLVFPLKIKFQGASAVIQQFKVPAYPILINSQGFYQ
ncbi:hypothetical protein UA38_12135 [Photobacterium kishitanii]|uniref:Integrating conjugative element protein n=1 Tax=Photobacterium kishitanii TaxID=318456 RepID=A0AAX0YSQ0_9GAMM|nr:integrating conjugative element protein [Photobacterium kishitanii]KJG57113.1 hypothetical protein UA38_12135 [Photobacterium kishitanii]KJG60642.1 hypothetical protein UA42_14945 [Photobacterium kishitanii]KJG64944.1 hypothetical protein UA40_14640 [Photobacterium kishitanii]KJG66185.1 hypothetical protein UA41_21305 [Photobacterium kishitanii]OBU31474.1 hypothetical protein AYY23_19630 [Photobacterium kishitanii]